MPAEKWTFLTNYSHVLLSIAADPAIRIRDVAERVGITERAAQRIVADLIEAGYVTASKSGRRNVYEVNGNLPLRHPLEQQNQVAVLFDLVAPAAPGARQAEAGVGRPAAGKRVSRVARGGGRRG